VNKPSDAEAVFTRRHLIVLALVVLATLAFAWLARRQGPEKSPQVPPELRQLCPLSNQLVIVGLDGADWSQLMPLLDAGRLPTLARLMQHGSYGHLETLLPTVSPAIWTSVATGKRPAQHGITDFTVYDAEQDRLVPATGRMRKSLALWNLLGYYGTPVGVVNWWTTWPAEPVEGFILTDQAATGRRKQFEEKDHWTQLDSPARESPSVYFPPALRELERRWTKAEVDAAALSRFADLTAEDQAELEALQSFETGNPLSVLKFSYLADRYYSDMTLGLLSENAPPELLLYYTASTDALAHSLWKYNHPEEKAPGLEAGDIARYGRTLERYYEWVDSLLERILSHYPEDVNVILLSDHGMIGMPDVTSGVKHLISARHSNHALVIVSGRDFRRDAVFATRRIEGENFERWKGSLNYQERGYRNLFPGGWMETIVVTPEGESELRVDYEVEGEAQAALQVRWDGSLAGTVSPSSPLKMTTRRGAHRLRLEYQPGSSQGSKVYPPSIPWTAAELGRERPRPFTPGEDWGYALWQEGETWHLRWSAYPGHLFEVSPLFSGELVCEQGFERCVGVPEQDEIQIQVEETTLRFEHRWGASHGQDAHATREGQDGYATSEEGGLDFVPRGPVTLDLRIDGDRYPRMVYLRPFSRAKVNAVTLRPAGQGSSLPAPSVLDVAPTTLALFGLPASEDMDGRIWKEHLTPEALERVSSVQVATYEGLPRQTLPEAPSRDETLDAEQLKRLEAMGYLFGTSKPQAPPSR